MKFETAVKDVVLRTHDVKSFRFPKPANLNYKPGQFMFVTIKSEKNKLKKHFSISSSPTEKDFIEFTKKLTGSEFSNALSVLKAGDWTMIDAPYGNFTFQGEYEKIGMLSGGIGITPLRSMCKYCFDMHLQTKITLIYGNRTANDIIFREELEEMQGLNSNIKVVLTVDEPKEDWSGQTGRINVEMIKKEIPDCMERVFYTCGPPAMVDAMVSLLKALNLSQKHIISENFPGY